MKYAIWQDLIGTPDGDHRNGYWLQRNDGEVFGPFETFDEATTARASDKKFQKELDRLDRMERRPYVGCR